MDQPGPHSWAAGKTIQPCPLSPIKARHENHPPREQSRADGSSEVYRPCRDGVAKRIPSKGLSPSKAGTLVKAVGMLHPWLKLLSPVNAASLVHLGDAVVPCLMLWGFYGPWLMLLSLVNVSGMLRSLVNISGMLQSLVNVLGCCSLRLIL